VPPPQAGSSSITIEFRERFGGLQTVPPETRYKRQALSCKKRHNFRHIHRSQFTNSTTQNYFTNLSLNKYILQPYSNMLFKSTNLIFAFAMAQSLLANPTVASETNDIVEIFHEKSAQGGSVTYYGEKDNTKVNRGTIDDRPELYRETTKSGGDLVFYGAATGADQRRDVDESAKMSKRCWWWGCVEKCHDEVDPGCDGKLHGNNGAPNDVCDKLLAELGDHSTTQLPQSPRQICYKDGKACCVSWGTKLPETLTKADLYKHVNKSKGP
jgi:hypothetical protein